MQHHVVSKKGVFVLIVGLILLGLGIVIGRYWSQVPDSNSNAGHALTNESSERQVLYWYDPMAPGQRFEQPGRSPFMDMDLVPRYVDEQDNTGRIGLSNRQQQNLGVKLATVSQRPLSPPLFSLATVAIDESQRISLSANASGVVSQLFVSAEQQSFEQGTPLFELWVPEWTSAQQEYLAVKQLGDRQLTRAARQKLLRNLMPPAIIDQVDKTGLAQDKLTVNAPISGYIDALFIRRGDNVTLSQKLMTLASIDQVWLTLDYPQTQLNLLHIGQAITAITADGQRYRGQIKTILPLIDDTTRLARARIVLSNPYHKLKPGMLVSVMPEQPTQAHMLAVPLDAVIMTAQQNRVIVSEGNGYYKAVEVTLGEVDGDWIAITSGLTRGQQIVVSGQFLIDSEASLRGALPQMSGQSDTLNETKNSQVDTVLANHEPTAQLYQGRGVIKGITGQVITLSHAAISELKWPAMIMDFNVAASVELKNLQPEQSVSFRFHFNDGMVEIIAITPETSHTADTTGGH